MEAVGATECRVGAAGSGIGIRGAMRGGTRVWGAEPNEAVSKTTHRDRSGRDPNHPHQRIGQDLDLPPVRRPPKDCVDACQGHAALSKRALAPYRRASARCEPGSTADTGSHPEQQGAVDYTVATARQRHLRSSSQILSAKDSLWDDQNMSSKFEVLPAKQGSLSLFTR